MSCRRAWGFRCSAGAICCAAGPRGGHGRLCVVVLPHGKTPADAADCEPHPTRIGGGALGLSGARGYLTIYELPAAPCAAWRCFCCALDAFTRWDWLGQVLYGLCMPGAVLALLFCDWAMYPLASFVSINSFLSHGLLTLVPILGLVSGKIRPAPRKIWKPFAFLAVTVPLIYLFDWAFSANYFFLRVPAPDSPLEWMAGFLGNPGYLLGYFVLLVLAECALFFALGPAARKSRQDIANEE